MFGSLANLCHCAASYHTQPASYMLRVLENYASRWRFDINHDKSKVVVFWVYFQNSQEASSEGGVLETVDSYKSLGLDLDPIKRRMWNTTLDRMAKKAKRCLNFLSGRLVAAASRNGSHLECLLFG